MSDVDFAEGQDAPALASGRTLGGTPPSEAFTTPRLLALETSGDTCGIALLRGEQLIFEHTFRHGMRLSERLIDFTERLLTDAGLSLADVDAFAVGIGPGSFTGVRIGVMTAKTWARTLQKPLFGVNALEALASHYAGLTGAAIIPLMPCRAGTVYAACYLVNASGDAPPTRLIAEPAVLSIADAAWLAQPSDAARVVFCGAAAQANRAELLAALAGSHGEQAVSFGAAEFPLASQVAGIARRRWTAENERERAGDAPLALAPLYVAPPQISSPKVAFKVTSQIAAG